MAEGEQQSRPLLVRMADSDIRPIPDPTVLTNELVAAAEIRVQDKLIAQRQYLEVRINDAMALLHAEIETTNKLKEEKFASIRFEFMRLEDVRREQKRDAEVNLEAALKARREASDKSDEALKEQVNQLRVTGEATATNLRRDIDGNKETILGRVEVNRTTAENRMYALENRLTTVEQRKEGARESSQDNVARFAAVAGWIVAVIGVIGWITSHNVSPVAVTSPNAPSVNVR